MAEIEPFPGKLGKKWENHNEVCYLTQAQAEWLRKYYPRERITVLYGMMGCGVTTLHRLARQAGAIREKVETYTSRQTNARNRAKARGYIISREYKHHGIVFFTSATMRDPKVEQYCRSNGLKVEEWKE